MTEIVQYQQPTALGDQMAFARAVVVRPEGAAASLLPQAYRDNPGNVLLAVGLGSSMGLSPAESLYRIDVIQGKPTASAELIAANVRKAGHRLRVLGNETTCTATIIRADDPDFEFTVTRDVAWAQAMGLTGKDNYKKQPGTMLQWRAITAVARLACPEALYGVAYTRDELYDDGAHPVVEQPTGLGAALGRQTVTAEQVPQAGDSGGSPAETSVAEGEAGSSPAGNPPESSSPDSVTSAQLKKIGAAMRDLGITERANALLYVSDCIGREVSSRNELTKDEAGRVIDSLETDLAGANGGQ